MENQHFIAIAEDDVKAITTEIAYAPKFPVGTLLRSGAHTYRVAEGSTIDNLLIEDLATHDVRGTQRSHLEMSIEQGYVSVISPSVSPQPVNMQFRMAGEYQEWIDEIPVSLRSEAAIKVMVSKYTWMQRLRNHNVFSFTPSDALEMQIKELEKKFGEKCPYGKDTIYEVWRRLNRNDWNIKCLLPEFHKRGGAGGRRLDEELELIVQKILAAEEEKKVGKLRVSGIHTAVVTAVIQANRARDPRDQMSFPSIPTIKRRFHDYFDAYQIAVRNYGKDRANLLFRESAVRIRSERPLDVVHYDDTDSCVFAVNERTWLPWGRCWITAGVDENTGCVTGLSTSEESRSTVSACNAVMHSMQRKDHSRSEFEFCKGKWEAWGNQGLVVLDNASYNASFEFQATLLDMGLQYEFARPHHPTDKSPIEHFNFRLKNEFSSTVLGWSGPKEDREMLDVGIGSAVLTVADFQKSLFRWIVDDYSNKPQRDGRTPSEKWREAFALHDPFPPRRRPSDELLGTIVTELTFRDSGGLLRNHLRYKSFELKELRARLGNRATVKVRYNPYRLDFIYVENPITKTYLKVACVEDPRIYSGITNRQHSLVIKRARQSFGHSFNFEQMYAAREMLVEDTKKLMHSRKMSERKRAVKNPTSAGNASANANGSASASANSPKKTEYTLVTELEAFVERIVDDCGPSDDEVQIVYLDD